MNRAYDQVPRTTNPIPTQTNPAVLGDQFYQLTRLLPSNMIKPPPQGKYGDYIPHHTINQRLLSILGPFNFEIVEELRGWVPAFTPKSGDWSRPERQTAVIGVKARLTATIDGQTVTVIEVGESNNPEQSNDAHNLKTGVSDALKRCAMRLGCGLHMWSKPDEPYWLTGQVAAARIDHGLGIAKEHRTNGEDQP